MQYWHWAMLWIVPLMWRRAQWRTWAVLMAASGPTYVLKSGVKFNFGSTL